MNNNSTIWLLHYECEDDSCNSVRAFATCESAAAAFNKMVNSEMQADNGPSDLIVWEVKDNGEVAHISDHYEYDIIMTDLKFSVWEKDDFSNYHTYIWVEETTLEGSGDEV